MNIFKFLKDIKGVIHVGANTGDERIIYGKYNIGAIYIEAVPSIFEELKQKIYVDFKTGKKFIALNYLVTDEDYKTYDFKVSSNKGLSSSIYDFKDHKLMWKDINMVETLKLKSLTLPTILKIEKIDIKNYDALVMDTQGSELLVLRGLERVINSFKYIMVEVADFESYDGCCVLKDIEDFMKKNGFNEHCRKLKVKKDSIGSYYDIVYKRSQDNWIQKIQSNEKRVYSQKGQDGIIEFIFKNIGTTNKFCVEFGFNSKTLTGGSGSNVARLVLDDGWNCLLLDCLYDNPSINLHKEFLKETNICSVFEKYRTPKEFDYLSIDVDSIDLWLMKSILIGGYKPRLISVEYNSNFYLDMSVTAKSNSVYRDDPVYGASLLALNKVAEEFNYRLVAAIETLDLFFISKDFVQENYSLEKFQKFTGIPVHRERGIPSKERLELLVEYPSMNPISDDIKQKLGWDK